MDRDVALSVLTAVSTIKTVMQNEATNTPEPSADTNRSVADIRMLESENNEPIEIKQPENSTKTTEGGN